MNFSSDLKKSIKASTLEYIKENKISEADYQKRESAILFKSAEEWHPNFHSKSFKNILNEESGDWANRLEKKHTHFKDETKEMESSNSSDSLLMTIFCHPSFFEWKGPRQFLEIGTDKPVFGWDPKIENHNRPTEVDLKIGKTIFEAKLTESGFTDKDLKIVQENYPKMGQIIDLERLKVENKVKHYQLLRNIYALYSNNDINRFVLIVDYRRPDLIRAFVEVIRLIKDDRLRRNCGIVTWQEIANTVGADLKSFLKLKYGI